MTTEREQRIAKGIEMAKERRLALELKQQERKEGIAFVHTNQIPIVQLGLSNCTVALGFMPATSKSLVVCAYALCSPVDNFSLKTAKGLIGNRFKNNSCFSLSVDQNELTTNAILHMALYKLMVLAREENSGSPARLYKAARSGEMEDALSQMPLLSFHR